MAPRKAPAAAMTAREATSAAQRPKRSTRTAIQPVTIIIDSEDESCSDSAEAAERPTRQRRQAAKAAQTAGYDTKLSAKAAATSRGAPSSGKPAQAAAVTTARASGAMPRRGRPANRTGDSEAESDEATTSGGESGDASDADTQPKAAESQHMDEQTEPRAQRPTRASRPRPAAAHAPSKAGAGAPPPPLSCRPRGRPAAGGKTSAAAAGADGAVSTGAGPSSIAAAGIRAAGRGQQQSKQVAPADDSEEDQGSDGSDEDSEECEVEHDEVGEQQQQGGSKTASGAKASRCKGKAGQPPTSMQSRKRLFELLERRIGAANDGGGAGGSAGRRVQYSELPVKNASKKAKLLTDLRSQFDDWHSRLRSNFSILLHGFGSKRGLLDDFARTLAGPRNRGDAAVLVFHGYNSRCTAREVVAGVAGALMQRTFRNLGTAGGAAGAAAGGVGGAPAALRALVDDIRQEPLDRHAFVVIHNLDGPGLRGDVSLLSALAACPQVHVIASIDHALGPLLWDSADAARFRWQYINATTFQPYLTETCGMQSVLVGAFKSGVVTAGAGTVLRSLVLGAQEVFKVLAEHLLDDEECEGVAFAHLYRMCRERFLVRDERVLRQHLVEFVDHQLVRLRPASDNSGELLTIPMSREDMRAVLDDLQAARGE